MGRTFANLHIKTKDVEKAVEALRELSEGHPKVLGENESLDAKVVMYISKSNESWISVLHDYFVWGTVKKIGKALSQLTGDPIMTASYMNEEIFELTMFEDGDIQAERIFCEPWTREEYEQLRVERLNDDYLQQALEISNEELNRLIKIASPEQAVNQLSELLSMSFWSDAEWVPYEESLRERFEKYEIKYRLTTASTMLHTSAHEHIGGYECVRNGKEGF